MIFTLEALNARFGDALLLHVGDGSKRELVLIDGGPPGVYRSSVKPRLDQLARERSEDPLRIKLMMVSHLDGDHIAGLVEMARDLEQRAEDRQPAPYTVGGLWLNSFDDVIGTDGTKLLGDVARGTPSSRGGRVVSPASLAVAASIDQGRTLRDQANRLGIRVNQGGGLIAAPPRGRLKVKVAGGLTFTVVAPSKQRLDDLQEDWDEFLRRRAEKEKEKAAARAAEYLDRSVFNLSSTVVLAESGRKRMLLTGDARGDDVLAGLTAARLLKEGRIHVDVLKLPHHGSDRNVETDFFRRVTADHYVISADGKHGNPEVATLKMLSEARGADEFTVHLTNREDRLASFFKREKSGGKRYQVRFRAGDALSMRIDLGDPLD